MLTRLITIQTAATEANTRARSLLEMGQAPGAERVYETFLMTLDLLLRDEEDAPPAWMQTVLRLAAINRRIPLDALGVTRLEQLRMRTIALLDTPEINSLGSLDDLRQRISNAIAVGAPRYNAGDIRGCGMIYWVTQHTLMAALVARGFSGYVRASSPIRDLMEREAPPLALETPGVDDFAWTLRRAFDDSLAVIG